MYSFVSIQPNILRNILNDLTLRRKKDERKKIIGGWKGVRLLKADVPLSFARTFVSPYISSPGERKSAYAQ
jgi:hypothetical protein